ncbi:MAG TPA: GAF domain-containing protein [Moraxellaceae bacterium]|nr:GAF domain-containing protein [Moraxellaceae bacterium]
MTSLHDLSIGKKLAALLLLFIFGLSAYVAFVFTNAMDVRTNSQHARSAYPLLLKLSTCNRLTTEMRDLYTVAVTSQDADMLINARQQARRVQSQTEQLTEDASAVGVPLPMLAPAFRAYARAADSWASAIVDGTGTPAKAQARLYELSLRQNAFTAQLDQSRAAINATFAANLREIEANADYSWRLGLFGGLTLSVVILILSRALSRRMIVQPLQTALAATGRIAAGNWDEPVPAHGRDEIGQLLEGIEKLRRELKVRCDQEQKNEFVSTLLADLNVQMRGDLSIAELCERTIRFLAPTLGCQIGLVYVNEGELLRPAAAYALRLDEVKPVPRGQSLVGQVAQSGQPALLQDLPDNYTRAIVAGSATMRPRNVAILPVLHNADLVAVLELGTTTPFDDERLSLIRRCSEDFAVVLKVAQARWRTAAAAATATAAAAGASTSGAASAGAEAVLRLATPSLAT